MSCPSRCTKALAFSARRARTHGSCTSSRTWSSATSTEPVVVCPSRLARKSRWSPAHSSFTTTKPWPRLERTLLNPVLRRLTASCRESLWGMVTTTGRDMENLLYACNLCCHVVRREPDCYSAEGCLALRGVFLLVDMAEIAGRRDLVSHHLLQLLDLGKAPVFAARPQQLGVDPD